MAFIKKVLTIAICAISMVSAQEGDVGVGVNTVSDASDITTRVEGDYEIFTGDDNKYAPCVSSKTCCCATGPVKITRNSAISNVISLEGEVKGGVACMDMTTLSGPFTMRAGEKTEAVLSVMGRTIVAKWEDDVQFLTFEYSVDPECRNTFVRKSPPPSEVTTQPPLPPLTTIAAVKESPSTTYQFKHKLASVKPTTGKARTDGYAISFESIATNGLTVTPSNDGTSTTTITIKPIEWAVVHYRFPPEGDDNDVPTTATTTTTTALPQVNMEMRRAFDMETGTQRTEIWEYGPIYMGKGMLDRLQYAFTLKPGDRQGAINTPWMSWGAGDTTTTTSTATSTTTIPLPEVSTTSTPTTTTTTVKIEKTPVISPATLDNHKNPITSRWYGVYETNEKKCVPGPKCCCGKGSLTVTKVHPDTQKSQFPPSTMGKVGPNTVLVTGKTSGPDYASCLGTDELHALFEVYPQKPAEAFAQAMENANSSPNATLSIMDAEGGRQLVIKNSIYENCDTVAVLKYTTDGSSNSPVENMGDEKDSNGLDAKDFLGSDNVVPAASTPRPPVATPSRPTVNRGQPTDQFNCMSKDVWSAAQRKYCCQKYARGCRAVPPPTDKFNCMSKDLWARAKSEYCCGKYGRGCRTPPRTTPPQPSAETRRSPPFEYPKTPEGPTKTNDNHHDHDHDNHDHHTVSTTAPRRNGKAGDNQGSPVPPTMITTTTNANTTVNAGEGFVGVYKWEESACNKILCCCGTGNLLIKAVPGKKGSIEILSTVSGGVKNQTMSDDPCRGQSVLAAEFTVQNSSFAKFSIQYPIPVAISAMPQSEGDQMVFQTRIGSGPQCVSRAARLADNHFEDETLEEEMIHNLIDHTKSITTAMDNNTNGTTDTKVKEHHVTQFVGSWEVTNDCVPSKECCCGKSQLTIHRPAHKHADHAAQHGDNTAVSHGNMSNMGPAMEAIMKAHKEANRVIYVDAKLDGGVGCYGVRSLSGPCKVIRPGYSACEVTLPGVETNNPPVIYLLTDKEGKVLTMKNTLYNSDTCAHTQALKMDTRKSAAFRPAHTAVAAALLGLLCVLSI